jgi:hypothetical protein
MLVHRFFLDVRSQDEVLRHVADTNNEWSPQGEWHIDFVKNLTLEEGLWLTQNAIIRPIGFTRESVADIRTAADSVNGVFQVLEETNVVYNERSKHWIHATNPATPNSLINGQHIKHHLPRGGGLNGHFEWYGVYNSANRTIVREGVVYSNLHQFSIAHLTSDRPVNLTRTRNAWTHCSREVDGIWVSMSDLKSH